MNKHIRCLLPVLGFAAMSCSLPEMIMRGQMDPAGAAAEAYNYPATIADPHQCNLTGWLDISQEIVHDETNEFGTRDCWFDLTIKNLHVLETVKVIAWFHKVDTSIEVGGHYLDQHEWDVLTTLETDKTDVWSGYYTLSNDDDGTGITLNAVERIAGISNIEICKPFFTDDEFLAQVAVDVPPACGAIT
jgi:hypothetical protein